MSNKHGNCQYCGGKCSDGTECGINIIAEEQDGVDGLPTAGVEAILQVVIETGENEEDVFDTRTIKDSEEYIRKNCHYDDIVIVDELVRRKDVTQLIQDKIDELNDELRDLARNDARKDRHIRRKKFKELLDEVQNQNE